MPSKSSRTRKSKEQRTSPSSSSPPRKPNNTSKPNPRLPARTTPPYFVLDTTLPSHISNDRLLFTTYTSSRHVYRTAFGTDLTIEGMGNVEVCVQAGGKSIIFTMHDCWHIPSSPHHFLSCLTVTSPTRRHQIMLAGRTPRLLFPHKDRLVTPNLPKYVPFARERGFFVLKFEVPTKLPVPPDPALADTKSRSQKSLSLHTSSCQPFAGLAFNRPSFYPSSPQLSLSSPPLEPLPVYPLSPPHNTSSGSSSNSTHVQSESSPSLLVSPSTSIHASIPTPSLQPKSQTAEHLKQKKVVNPADVVPHGVAEVLSNLDALVVLNRGGDVGVDVGSHGGACVESRLRGGATDMLLHGGTDSVDDHANGVVSTSIQQSSTISPSVSSISFPSTSSSTFKTLPDLSSIPLLRSRSDFFAWDEAICTLLRALGLFGHVLDPSSPSNLQPTSRNVLPEIRPLLSQSPTSSESTAFNIWVDNENITQYIISSRIGTLPRQLLPSAHDDTRTAFLMYTTLSNHFGLRNFFRSLDFANSLFSSTCNPDKVMDYVARWRIGVTHLKSVDFHLSARTYIYRFVRGLPPSLTFSSLRALLPQQLRETKDDDMDAFISTTDRALDLADIFAQAGCPIDS